MAPSLSGLITAPKTRFQIQSLPSGSLESMKWKEFMAYISDKKNSRIKHVSRKSRRRRGRMKKKTKKKKKNTPVRIIFGYNRHYIA